MNKFDVLLLQASKTNRSVLEYHYLEFLVYLEGEMFTQFRSHIPLIGWPTLLIISLKQHKSLSLLQLVIVLVNIGLSVSN